MDQYCILSLMMAMQLVYYGSFYVTTACISHLHFAGNCDYLHVNKTVLFTREQAQCVDIKVFNDDLSEEDEYFTVELISGTAQLSSANVTIHSNCEHCQVKHLSFIDTL